MRIWLSGRVNIPDSTAKIRPALSIDASVNPVDRISHRAYKAYFESRYCGMNPTQKLSKKASLTEDSLYFISTVTLNQGF